MLNDVRLKGVYCPACRDGEDDRYIEISTFQDYYGVESVRITCSCGKHHIYKLVQIEEDL